MTMYSFILFALLGTMFCNDPKTQLRGKWKVKKVVVKGVEKYPTRDYFMEFDGKRISYNLLVNHCSTENLRISGESISCIAVCTEICCDDQDPFTNYLDYSGAYKTDGKSLTITGEQHVIHLDKME